MDPDGSVTTWLHQLQAGAPRAVQPLWERYVRRLVGLARQKLRGRPRAVADEEDVALSAFASFCRGVEAGRFPRLDDRDDLWQVLVVLTARKAVDQVRRESRRKRGGGVVIHGEASLAAPADSDADGPALEQIPSREPTPEFAAEVAEEFRRRLARLNDPELAAIAQWKMEGYTNEEIAGRLGCVARSVKRKLQLIRRLWTEEGTP